MFIQCHQGNHIVTDYVDEFQRLNASNNLNEDSSYEVLHFVSDLKEAIKDRLGTRAQIALAVAITVATKYESILNRTHHNPYPTRSFPDFYHDKPTSSNNYSQQPPQNGHKIPAETMTYNRNSTRPSLPPPKNNPYTKPAPVKCFKCLQPGHRSSNCPQGKSVHYTVETADTD